MTAALFLAAFAIVAAGACSREPSIEERADQRIVATKFDPSANFGDFESFAVADSIPLLTISAVGDVTSDQVLEPNLSVPILRETASQLTARGYREVARTENADIGIAVTALARVKTETLPYGAWWGYGSASSDFWGYAGVPSVFGVDYETIAWVGGTLIIEIVDLRAARDSAGPIITQAPQGVSPLAASATSALRVVWVALIHGVVREADQSFAEPPLESIQQAFRQSPYVHR